MVQSAGVAGVRRGLEGQVKQIDASLASPRRRGGSVSFDVTPVLSPGIPGSSRGRVADRCCHLAIDALSDRVRTCSTTDHQRKSGGIPRVSCTSRTAARIAKEEKAREPIC